MTSWCGCTTPWRRSREGDARAAQVVELRFFAGMTEPEVAEALGVTDRTVRRDWEKARLLLSAMLGLKLLSPSR